MADSAAADAAKTNVTADVFLQAVEELDVLVTKKDNAVAAIRHARNRFKGLGIDLKALDGALADKKAYEDDASGYQMTMAARERYKAWLELPVGQQASLDLTPPTPEHKERLTKLNAHTQGYEACKRGDPRSSNPHDAGTIAHVAFDQGWQDRERDEFEGAKPANGSAPAPKAKPGRPKKGAGPEITAGAVQPAPPAPPAASEMPDIPDSLKRVH